MVYVNKKDEVRFHCFGACKGDWDIYDMLKPVVNAISGFSLKRLKTDTQYAGRGYDVKMPNIMKDDVRT